MTVEQVLFGPAPEDGPIVAAFPFRDYIVIVTRRAVYRMWHDEFTGSLITTKTKEIPDDAAPG